VPVSRDGHVSAAGACSASRALELKETGAVMSDAPISASGGGRLFRPSRSTLTCGRSVAAQLTVEACHVRTSECKFEMARGQRGLRASSSRGRIDGWKSSRKAIMAKSHIVEPGSSVGPGHVSLKSGGMMKRVALWASIIFVLGTVIFVLGIATVWQLYPESTYLMFATVRGAITANHHPPKIVEGQFSDGEARRNPEHAGRKLTALLEQKFPTGTSDSVLKSELLGQGFKFLPPPPPNCLPPGQSAPVGVVFTRCFDPTNKLKYEWGDGFVCSNSLLVTWSTNGRGEITRIEAHYRETCL